MKHTNVDYSIAGYSILKNVATWIINSYGLFSLENSSVKGTLPVIAFVFGLILQGAVTQASADDIAASFERMLNPGETVGQSAVTYRVERDPLHTMVNAALWSDPTGYDNIAASFEHMLNPVETARQSVVAYLTERDPLHTIVNAALWSDPTGYDNIAASFEHMLNPVETAR